MAEQRKRKRTRKVKPEVERATEQVKGVIEQRLEEIDEDIAKVNQLLEPYENLKAEINKLQAARRALLGGNRSTGAGGTKLRQEDIVRFLGENPGSTPSEIGKEFGVSQSTVSSALYRGKDERYLTTNKQWWLRDPKNGINTIEDLLESEALSEGNDE